MNQSVSQSIHTPISQSITMQLRRSAVSIRSRMCCTVSPRNKICWMLGSCCHHREKETRRMITIMIMVVAAVVGKEQVFKNVWKQRSG